MPQINKPRDLVRKCAFEYARDRLQRCSYSFGV